MHLYGINEEDDQSAIFQTAIDLHGFIEDFPKLLKDR